MVWSRYKKIHRYLYFIVFIRDGILHGKINVDVTILTNGIETIMVLGGAFNLFQMLVLLLVPLTAICVL